MDHVAWLALVPRARFNNISRETDSVYRTLPRMPWVVVTPISCLRCKDSDEFRLQHGVFFNDFVKAVNIL